MRTFERRGARRSDIGALGVMLAATVLVAMVAGVSAVIELCRYL